MSRVETIEELVKDQRVRKEIFSFRNAKNTEISKKNMFGVKRRQTSRQQIR